MLYNEKLVGRNLPREKFEEIREELSSIAFLDERLIKRSLLPLFPFIAFPYLNERSAKAVLRTFLRTVKEFGEYIFSLGLEYIEISRTLPPGIRKEPFLYPGFSTSRIYISGPKSYLLSALDSLEEPLKVGEAVEMRRVERRTRIPFKKRPTYITAFIFFYTDIRNAEEDLHRYKE